MFNILKDGPLLREEFHPCPFHSSQNIASTREENNETNGCSNSYDAGLAVVPFARSSKTVRRNSENHHENEYHMKNPTHDLLPSSSSPRRFQWETIGHASREGSKDGIRVEQLSSIPFPFGVFGNRVVARRSSPTWDDGALVCAHILKEDLPHPSKIMRRKKYSKTRQKKCGMDLESHIAQLRRKHAEFNWLPKAVSTDDSYLDSEQEDIVLPERTLQKVPNWSSPLPRNQLWPGVIPGLYSESPHDAWPKYAPDNRLSIQDQTIPNTSGLFEPKWDDDNEDDFHLNIGYAARDSTSQPSDEHDKQFSHIAY